jgi:hypothetical protein
MQKTCVVMQEKRFRAPAPPLLVAAQAAVAGCGTPAAGLAPGAVAAWRASTAVAARGPAAAGLAAHVAVAGAAAASAAAAGAVAAGAAALGGPVWRLGRRPLVLGGWGLQLPDI